MHSIDDHRRAARTLPGHAWTPPAPTLAQLLDARSREHGHRPLLTFHDGGTGERTELSYATVENWVAKTANLLAEEFDIGAADGGSGPRVATLLGAHWTGAVVALACWTVGATLVAMDGAAPDPRGSDVAFVREDLLASAGVGGVRDVVVVGTGMGARLTTDPGDRLGYAEEVLAFGDHFDGDEPGPDADAVIVPAAPGALRLTHANLLAAAETVAGWWELDGEDRLLLTGLDPHRSAALGLLPALHAGASVVSTQRSPADELARHVSAERITGVVTEAATHEDTLAALDDPPPTLRRVLCPAPPPAAWTIDAGAAPPVSYGHGLAAATFASAFTPHHVDAATAGWLATRSGCVGVPSALAQVAAFDAAGGLAARGEEGLLGVRGPLVTAGVADGDDAELFAGGWLRTGQRGVVDEAPDGRVFVFLA